MSTFIAGIALVALALGPTNAAETDQEAEAATKEQVAKVDEDPTVCKKVKVTGSRVRDKRICKPQSYWDELERKSNDALNGMRGPQSRPCGPNGCD